MGAVGLEDNTLGLEVIGNARESYSLNASDNAFDNDIYRNSLPSMPLNSNFNLAMVSSVYHLSRLLRALKRKTDELVNPSWISRVVRTVWELD